MGRPVGRPRQAGQIESARNESNVPAKLSPNAVIGTKETLNTMLDKMKSAMLAVLPKYLTPEKILKTFLVYASRHPKIFQCTQQSVALGIMQGCELGLPFGGLGLAHLVPYWNSKINACEAVFIPGYAGLIQLAMRSEDVVNVSAQVVYSKDRFEISLGTDQKVVHVPNYQGNRGDVIGAYAIVEYKNGSKAIEWMDIEQLDSIKNRSKAKDSGPWVTDEAEMQRKTVLKRVLKYAPKCVDVENAIQLDNQATGYSDIELNVAPEPSEPPKPAVESLVNRLTSKMKEQSAEQIELPEADKGESASIAEIARVLKLDDADMSEIRAAHPDDLMEHMTKLLNAELDREIADQDNKK